MMDITTTNEVRRHGFRVGDEKTGCLEDGSWKRANGQVLSSATYPSLAALNQVYPNTTTLQSTVYSQIGESYITGVTYAGQSNLLAATTWLFNEVAAGVTTYGIHNYIAPDLSFVAGKTVPYNMRRGSAGAPHRMSFAGIAYINGAYSTVLTGRIFTNSGNALANDTGYLTAMGSVSGITFNTSVPRDFTDLSTIATDTTTGTGFGTTYYGGSIAAGNGKFLFLYYPNGGTVQAMTSTDGKTYTATNTTGLPGSTSVFSPANAHTSFANGNFWLGYGNTTVYKSADGISWSTVTIPSATRKIIDANGNLYALRNVTSNTISVSTDNGANWSLKTLPTSLRVQHVSYISNRLVLIGSDTQTYLTSEDDGASWTTRFLPGSLVGSFGQGAVANSASKIVVHAGLGILYVSDDGLVWRTTNMQSLALSRCGGDGNTTYTHTRIDYAGDKFFISGVRGNSSYATSDGQTHIWYSTDGEHWGFDMMGPTTKAYGSSAGVGVFSHSDDGQSSIYSSPGTFGNNCITQQNGKISSVEHYLYSSSLFNPITGHNGAIYKITYVSGSYYVVQKSTDGGFTFDAAWILPRVGAYNGVTIRSVSGLLVVFSTAASSGFVPCYLEESTNTWKTLFNDGSITSIAGNGTSLVVTNNSTTIRTINATTFTSTTITASAACFAVVYHAPINQYILTAKNSTSYTWDGSALSLTAASGTSVGSMPPYQYDHTLISANGYVYMIAPGVSAGVVFTTNAGSWLSLSVLPQTTYVLATTGHGTSTATDGIFVGYSNTLVKVHGNTTPMASTVLASGLTNSHLTIPTATTCYVVPNYAYASGSHQQLTVGLPNQSGTLRYLTSSSAGNALPYGDKRWSTPLIVFPSTPKVLFGSTINPYALQTSPLPSAVSNYGVVGNTFYSGTNGTWFYTSDMSTFQTGRSNWLPASPTYKFTDSGVYVVDAYSASAGSYAHIWYGTSPLNMNLCYVSDFFIGSVLPCVGGAGFVFGGLNSAGNYDTDGQLRMMSNQGTQVSCIPVTTTTGPRTNSFVKIGTDAFVGIQSPTNAFADPEVVISHNTNIVKLPTKRDTLIRVL